ncbi:MAG: hypothetical protein U0271_15565 [Polyangiaceae bacterium]
MGMVQCSKHGLTDLARACGHVHAAVLAGRPELVSVIHDTFGIRLYVCSACAARFGPVSESLAEQGPLAACFECFAAWREAISD